MRKVNENVYAFLVGVHLFWACVGFLMGLSVAYARCLWMVRPHECVGAGIVSFSLTLSIGLLTSLGFTYVLIDAERVKIVKKDDGGNEARPPSLLGRMVRPLVGWGGSPAPKEHETVKERYEKDWWDDDE